ncbi:MAG: outer membrane lipoprotein-sorting protein [candidate division Zixibacteria bacterium]|nr:outer membrane lipoprotein-sorting protein [candidate division Zixibacteria bacterium]
MTTIKKIQILIVVMIVALPVYSFAQEKITGLQIIENVYNRQTGNDMQSDLTMSLTNSRGDERVREIKQFIKEFDESEKKIMFFVLPADVRNTSFMNWSYDEVDKDDDQWIYLPALKKVKRISSDSKSDYFMGSDFTYDDLGDRKPTQDNHKLLREEKVDGEDCFVVESIPKDEEYMYSRTVSWIIKDKWIGMKKEFYDEDEEHLKTLIVKKYEKIKDYWIILHSQMHNVQKDHTTDMELENVIIDSGIPDRKFTERIMKRGL